MLEFNHEDIQTCIDEIDDLIEDVQESLDEAELEELQSHTGNSIYKAGDYEVEVADYKNSIDFYEAIKNDLQEFLDEVDENVKFTRYPWFLYDQKLETEIEDLKEETSEFYKSMYMDVNGGEQTPFSGSFEKGNIFHQGSPE